jgi:hypothetical protein
MVAAAATVGGNSLVLKISYPANSVISTGTRCRMVRLAASARALLPLRLRATVEIFFRSRDSQRLPRHLRIIYPYQDVVQHGSAWCLLDLLFVVFTPVVRLCRLLIRTAHRRRPNCRALRTVNSPNPVFPSTTSSPMPTENCPVMAQLADSRPRENSGYRYTQNAILYRESSSMEQFPRENPIPSPSTRNLSQ